jgi:hypothetical protein
VLHICCGGQNATDDNNTTTRFFATGRLVISATKLHNQQVLDYSGMRFEDFLQLGWKKYMHPDDFSQNPLCWSSMTIQMSELRLAVCCQRSA